MSSSTGNFVRKHLPLVNIHFLYRGFSVLSILYLLSVKEFSLLCSSNATQQGRKEQDEYNTFILL